MNTNSQPVRALHRVTFSIACLLVLIVGGVLVAQRTHAQEPQPAQDQQVMVTQRLQDELAASDGTVEMLVILRDQMNAAAVAAAMEPAPVASAGADPHQRGAAIYQALTAHALESQAPLRDWLDARNIPYRAYYMVNMLLVQGDAALAQALSQRADIARLSANPASPALQTVMPTVPPSWRRIARTVDPAGAGTPPLPWGLDFIRAPEAWALGHTGEGIVVASQDTGVQWDHPALLDAYRGWNATTMTATHPYNWFDAWGADNNRLTRCPDASATDAQIPCDDHGHGTHTVGTMVGDASMQGSSILGVAPDAEWIACRNMTGGVGSPASYADCFQFFLAPYPQGGDAFTDGKPELAAHIINNSWGCPLSEGCDDPNILRQVVETARAAGQFVVSSAGNNGYQGCSSIAVPTGIYDAAFTVGALDASGTLAGYSSRGPVTVDGSNRIKPDIAAPGTGVYSSYINDGYTTLNGTSMAAPHVAGVVALLWSAIPALIGDIDATEALLRQSATPVSDVECGGEGALSIPNNRFGAGQINAYAALLFALETPSLRVTVVNADREPLPRTVVNVVNVGSGHVDSQTTNAAGIVTFPAILTREWIGEKEMLFVLDQGTQAQILVDAPVRLFLPRLN